MPWVVIKISFCFTEACDFHTIGNISMLILVLSPGALETLVGMSNWAEWPE